MEFMPPLRVGDDSTPFSHSGLVFDSTGSWFLLPNNSEQDMCGGFPINE
jgi:hypothetical protein